MFLEEFFKKLFFGKVQFLLSTYWTSPTHAVQRYSAVFKLKLNVGVSHIYEIPLQQLFILLVDQQLVLVAWPSWHVKFYHHSGHLQALLISTRQELLQIPVSDVCMLTSILPRPFEQMSLGFRFQAFLWITLAPCSSPMALFCFVLVSSLSQCAGRCLFWAMDFKQTETFI